MAKKFKNNNENYSNFYARKCGLVNLKRVEKMFNEIPHAIKIEKKLPNRKSRAKKYLFL